MKAVCLILALMLSVLATYPCSDTATCADEQKTGLTVAPADHDHSSAEMDICSPLCVCNCCSTHANPPVIFHFEAKSFSLTEYNSSLEVQSLKTVYFAIWQPPKVA